MIYKEVARQPGKQQPGRLGNEMEAAPPPPRLLETGLPSAGLGPSPQGLERRGGGARERGGTSAAPTSPQSRGNKQHPRTASAAGPSGCRKGLRGRSPSALILNRKEGREY